MGEIAPSFDKKRQILGEIYPLDTPFTVILDVSEACNFRCGFCFRGQDDKSKWGYAKDCSLISENVFKEAVRQIKLFPSEVKQISLSNHGEPLCNRRLPEMVRYIKNQGITSRVSIHTNASLLDEQYAIELAESRIDRIVVSLEGMSAEKYRNVCGVEIDYEEFYNNLVILSKHKKNTQLYFKIMDIALDEGEEEKFYTEYKPIGDRVYIEHMVPIWKDVKLPKNNHAIENKYGESFDKQECCPLIFHTIVVTPKGDVYPCTQLINPYRLGNIMEDELQELWNCELRRDLLKRQCTLNNHEMCKDCFILQNSIYSQEDMIDSYRKDILDRLTLQ